MTIEEKFALCNTLRDEANAAIAAEDQQTAAKKVEALKAAIVEYNEDWKKKQYDEFIASENPVLTAIKRLHVYKLSVSAKTNKDTGDLKEVSIKSTASPKGKPGIMDTIDLVEIEDRATVRICNNGQWRYWVENFTVMMGARVCESVGNKAKAEYYRNHIRMSPEARAAGKVADSNTTVSAELQKIVDAILFMDSGKTNKAGQPLNAIKITSGDLEYIRAVMCKETAGLNVGLPSDKTMRRLITKAIHRVVTNKEYGFIFDEADDVDLPEIPGASKAQVRAIVAESE